MDKTLLVIIDGNAILYRAYHALPGFTTSKGQPVGAIFGFVSMFLRILTDLKPSHMIVTFDRPAPTFRQAMYADYHANRKAMEDDLVAQIDGIHEIIASFGVPIFEVDGYEADDVIGTLAYQAVGLQTTGYSKEARKTAVDRSQSTRDEKSEVIIVTGDRDLLQLVNEHVKVYMPIKGMSETKLFGKEEVVEKFGVNPSQVVDLKALMGDASDNYPGVLGIGPKTASQLIKTYETLENVYQHLNELPQKQMKSLVDGAEDAALAKKLATIATDVPIHLSWEEAKFHIPNVEKVLEVFLSFELKTLSNRFREFMGEKPAEKQVSSLKIVNKTEEKKQLELL